MYIQQLHLKYYTISQQKYDLLKFYSTNINCAKLIENQSEFMTNLFISCEGEAKWYFDIKQPEVPTFKSWHHTYRRRVNEKLKIEFELQTAVIFVRFCLDMRRPTYLNFLVSKFISLH